MYAFFLHNRHGEILVVKKVKTAFGFLARYNRTGAEGHEAEPHGESACTHGARPVSFYGVATAHGNAAREGLNNVFCLVLGLLVTLSYHQWRRCVIFEV
jgi:hypothetical protein